jgi:hypothetical protein
MYYQNLKLPQSAKALASCLGGSVLLIYFYSGYLADYFFV